MSNVLIQPRSGILDFNTGIADSNLALSTNLSGSLRFTYDNQGGIEIKSFSTGKNRFSVEGSQGQIFSITDDLSGSLFRVNDINGLPFFETFDTNTAILGAYPNKTFVVSGNSVGIGLNPNTVYRLQVSGNANVIGQLQTSGFLVAKNNDLLSTGILLATNLSTTGSNLKIDLINSGINLQTNINNLQNSSDTFLRLDDTTQSVLGNKTFLGNVIIQNLTVTGTTSSTSSSDLSVASNFININSGEQGLNGIGLLSGGIRIDRGTGLGFPDGYLIFSEVNNRFEFGLEGSLSGVAPIELLQTTISNLNTTGNDLFLRDVSLSGRLNQSGEDLTNRTNSLSGSLNLSGLNLRQAIASLSGSLNESGTNLFIQSSNVQANLNVSGLTLKNDLKDLSGSALLLYGNQTVNGLKEFLTPPTINGLTIVTSNNIGDQANLVLQTGNQTISGIKSFADEIFSKNLVYNTGNQIVSGIKNFNQFPQVNGNPVLVSGQFGSIDVETARINIANGSIEQSITFVRNYGDGNKPIVIANLHFTGLSDEIISHQIQNVNHTGFTISLSRPVTGYSVNYWAMQNTGASFLALSARSLQFAQKNNLDRGVLNQFITFTNTLLTSSPMVNLSLEDRNNPPTENFFLLKATGINPTGFFLCLSQIIPATDTGYFLHTQVTP